MQDPTVLRDIFTTGLRNAHAMENQALSMMKPQVARIEKYPEMSARLKAHIAETEGQIGRLETILGSLDEDNSTLKDLAMSIGGSVAAMGHSLADDEILKNTLASFAFENYEIAAYRSLISLSEMGGFNAAKPLLEQNLQEEKAMAAWLETELPTITRRYADLSMAGQSAGA